MTTEMRRPAVWAASPWLLAALLAAALTACGQDNNGGSATAGDSEGAAPADTNPGTSVDPEDAAILYAQCMRDNGVPDFPDPGPSGHFALDHDEFDRDDPDFRAAMEACRDLAPGDEYLIFGDPIYVEQMLEFSQCMRDNDLLDFPDPDAEGRLRLGHEAQGDPKFRAALEACRDQLPGGHYH